MNGYTTAARYLHWSIAGLIVLQFVLAEWAESAEHASRPLQQLSLLANHKSVGITVLVLALVRLGWRFTHVPPALPGHMPGWQRWAAQGTHGLFYLLLFALPLSGWLMSSASAYSVSWFNLIPLPDLIGADPDLKETFEDIHEALAQVLFVLAGVHVAAALVHHFRDRDGVLLGMSNAGAIAVGAVLLAGGVGWLGFGAGGASSVGLEDHASAGRASSGVGVAPAALSPVPAWAIDYANSAIQFTAEQAGAAVHGRFAKWEGVIQFDPERLEVSAARVEIELASVDTRDAERDATLSQDEWFGGGIAVFRAGAFEQVAELEFDATDATLAFDGQAYPVEFRFKLQRRGADWVLTGTSRLDRSALRIGTGEWADTTWVGQFVDVNVNIQTLPR